MRKQTNLGVSVIICCYNSADRIQKTLEFLQAQIIDKSIHWEVIIVNNASSDDTAKVAEVTWNRAPIVKLHVVNELTQGLSHARIRGMRVANFEFLSFIDDDNWVQKDWVSIVFAAFMEQPAAGACGGSITAEFETQRPSWFDRFQAYYAVGEQADRAGEMEGALDYLCGAGLSIRKSVFEILIDKGFSFDLVGRQGKTLLSSEDVELCLAIKLAGWKLFYEPRLKLKHYMPDFRLNWEYLQKLARGTGVSYAALIPYHYEIEGNRTNPNLLWALTVSKLLKSLLVKTLNHTLNLRRLEPYDEAKLEFEKLKGLVSSLLKRREQFVKSTYRIRNAAWIKGR